MKLYHCLVGFPQTVKIPTGNFLLSYSEHAKEEAENDRYGRITLPENIVVHFNKVIECGINASKVVKMLVRMKFDNRRDICIVFEPFNRNVSGGCHVRTVWFCETRDSHRTLDTSKYCIPE